MVTAAFTVKLQATRSAIQEVVDGLIAAMQSGPSASRSPIQRGADDAQYPCNGENSSF